MPKKINIELINYFNAMGFIVKSKKCLRVLKAIIYRLVRNIMENIMSVTGSTCERNDRTIEGKHVEMTQRVCNRCIQKGGHTVLPLDYFSGQTSPHYVPENMNHFQTTSAVDGFARQGMVMRMVGGKPSDYQNNQVIVSFIRQCIKEYFARKRVSAYIISECAIKNIAKSIHHHIVTIFDIVFAMHCNGECSSQPVLLDINILIDVIRSNDFAYLK